jgi:hypothetical protein
MFGAPGSLRRSKNQRLFLLPAESGVTRGTVNLPQLRFTAGAFGFLTLTQHAERPERLGERIKKESCYFID